MVKAHLAELLEKSKLELIKMLLEKEDFQVPLSIFSTELGPLEALVFYLKEKKGMEISEISFRLNRSKQTIWTTYYKTKGQKIKLDESGIKIPLSIFSKTNTSLLENLTYYLRTVKEMKFSESAMILKRDIRTIHTCFKRYEKKNRITKNMFKEEIK